MLKSILKSALRSCGLEIKRIATNPVNIPIYVDYPVNPQPRWGYGLPVHSEIEASLDKNRASYIDTLHCLAKYQSVLYDIPVDSDPKSPHVPAWRNRFIEGLDAVALCCFMLDRVPARYVEIGSGNSTKFVRHSIGKAGLGTTITSLDPEPRVQVDELCDHVIRNTLEGCDLSLFNRLEAGDILFYDGSHRVFTNSDVTVFFLEVLPRLRAGVLVHIHDIFLPSDYFPEWNGRFYSEQYILAAMLLSSETIFDVVLPVRFIQTDLELSKASLLAFEPLRSLKQGLPWDGTSFWIETKEKSDAPLCKDR
jgi:hypothetical protein